jgi:cytoskeleton protein RodZ
MTSIGETLRRERLKRKLDLQGVSGELKISPRLLEAIEDENFDKLPGGVFTKSFVRQYARLLGLDEDEISSELQRVLEPHGAMPQSPQAPLKQAEIPLPRVADWESVGDPRFQWSRSLPALGMVLIMMFVCAGVYSWWQRSRRPAAAHDSKPARVQTATTAPITPRPAPEVAPQQPAAPEEVKPDSPSSAPGADGKVETSVASDVGKGAAQPAGTAAPGAPPAPSPTPAAGVGSEAPIRVEMTADEPVWVSAHSDGKYLFSTTLQANESRTAEANGTLVLKLGNAGGIRISLNGKPIGPVGPKGQIRTVQLTSGGFQILLPEPPQPASPNGPVDPL